MIENIWHLSKNILKCFDNGELKRLVIGYSETYSNANNCLWCEIDLRSDCKTSVYISGMSPMMCSLGFAAFEPEFSYKKKTKVYECTIPENEMFFFLGKIFRDYDLRLLGEYARTHFHIDCIEEISEGLTVELEGTDGIVDIVNMNRYSVGGRILMSIIKECETLKSIFVV